jgi:hypothetical protein
VKVHGADKLPELSVATHVTVVTPSGNNDPLAGVLVMFVTAQLSVAVGVKVTCAPHWPGSA